jgi:hypothetical protein
VAVRRQRLAGAAEPGLGGRPAYMPSDSSDAVDPDAGRQRVLAFSDNSRDLVVRDGAQTLRVFSIAENGDSQIALSEVLTVDIPDDMQSFSQPSWSQRPLLAAVQLGPVWRFAWVDASGRAAVLDSGPASGPPRSRTFLSGANGARELNFSKDGRFLILQHYASPGLHVRVWDLDDARAREVAAMDMVRLREEACRIAAFESNRLSDTEKITWTRPNAPQPCGEN